MYDVIKYIWQLEPFRDRLREMAELAEAEIESELPPLFLRFLNLLINDAIFLLDEGLGYMKQLQEQEAEDRTALPAAERTEAERSFQHTGQLARYHNMMAGETIGVLELLTGSITAVITHPTLADR
jgi:ubiquitin conjugation factor E4 A